MKRLLLLLVGCAHAYEGWPITFSPPTPGTGTVYVYRPTRARRELAMDYVAVGERTGMLPNGSVVAFDLAPGRHELRLAEALGASFATDQPIDAGAQPVRVTVDVVAGNAAFVRLITGDPPTAEIVDEKAARDELGGLTWAPGGAPRFVPEN